MNALSPQPEPSTDSLETWQRDLDCFIASFENEVTDILATLQQSVPTDVEVQPEVAVTSAAGDLHDCGEVPQCSTAMVVADATIGPRLPGGDPDSNRLAALKLRLSQQLQTAGQHTSPSVSPPTDTTEEAQ